MPIGDLTTLANVKSQSKTTSIESDVLLSQFITRVSRVLLGFMNRDSILPSSGLDLYDGRGGPTLQLKRYPVLSVEALSIGGISINPATYGMNGTPAGSGFFFDKWSGSGAGRPARISLLGYTFCEGLQNVAVQYTAGYQTSGEVQVIPTDGVVAPLSPNGMWASDVSVIDVASGNAMTPVANNPVSGQYVAPTPYALQPNNPVLTYKFATADAAKQVSLSYGYVPSDLEGVCVNTVIERFKYKDRVAEQSHSTGGSETVSFKITDLPPFDRMTVQQFRSVVPFA